MAGETRRRAKQASICTEESERLWHVDGLQSATHLNMWQQDNNPYASSSNYYPQQQPAEQLQFYAQTQDYYAASRSSLDSQVQGSMSQPAFGGNMQNQGAWWTAFGTGGVEGEPPLLEGKLSQPLLCG